jgi:hypothetical protein
MTRISKQGRIRNVSRRRPKVGGPKTGTKKDALEFGYKPHSNTVVAEGTPNRFIPKIG